MNINQLPNSGTGQMPLTTFQYSYPLETLTPTPQSNSLSLGVIAYNASDNQAPMASAQVVTATTQSVPLQICPGTNHVQGFTIIWDGKTVTDSSGLVVTYAGKQLSTSGPQIVPETPSELLNMGQSVPCEPKILLHLSAMDIWIARLVILFVLALLVYGVVRVFYIKN